jgi:Tol biopolymer transport system component/DNA-binding winged helix-turn-helix (wHTH) protein
VSESSASALRVIRFGAFELDLHAGELRKAGVRLNLPAQSFHVLALLLERPDDLVTREELRQRLWPDGTFVDFDHGLNAVINRLRETLADSADSPRFIQTVPRRGYRFIAPVDLGVQGGEVRGQPASEAGSIRPDSSDTESASRHGGTRRYYSRAVWSAVVLALAMSAVLAVYLSRPRPSPRRAMQTIPLTSLAGKERDPSFSPDGGQVAFVWDGEKGDNEDIYVKVIGTDVPLRLTTNPAADRYPAWSPDGRHIAFQRSSGEESGLFMIPALGGPERKIRSRSHLAHCRGGASWSPDGQFLAIADDAGYEGSCSIFILSLETLKTRKLTSPPAGAHGDSAPAFSPDGRTIAFNRLGSAGGIYVVPAAGGDPKRVTPGEYVWLQRLAWLPTGRELIFSSSGIDAESGSLWRVSASGGTPERLAVGGDNAANPAVSPRGNRLAYEQRRDDANIWKIAVPQPPEPTPSPVQLIASSRQEAGPHVSPDGKRIAFHSDRTGSLEIWMSDTAGSSLVQVTSFGGPIVGTPRWSPDSRRLAFEGLVKGNGDIYLIDVEGGLPRRVTTEPSVEAVASWSADGHWIYFASNRTGRSEVWKAPAEGGRALQVTKRGGFAAFESADGTVVYYSKGLNVAGLWKVPVNGGDETAVLDFPNANLWGYWALASTGIYFVSSNVSPQPALQFFSFGESRVSQVVALDKRPVPREAGIAISPDGRWLLYTQMDYRSSDLILVENFD